MRDIGKNIKSLREEYNMTQEELAEKLFVTRQTISNYETGKSNPDIEVITKIAETFKTDANTIIYGKEEYRTKQSERKKLIVSMLLLLSMVISYYLLIKTGMLFSNYYDTRMYFAVIIFAKPLVLLVFGNTLMQVLSLFIKIQKTDKDKSKKIKLTVLSILSAYTLIMFPAFLIMLIKVHNWSIPGFYWNIISILLGMYPNEIPFLNFAPIAIIAGAALWFCNNTKQN